MFKYSDILIKKKYCIVLGEKYWQLKWQEEPGGNLMGKSLQSVQLIKQSSENLTVVLCSALITPFLLFHHIL